MVCLAVRMSPQPIRLVADVGTKGGLHTGGAAKALLAYAPPDVIETVLERHLHEFVPAKLRTRKQVLGVLEKIRHDGVYEAVGEIDPDIYTLTAPVHDGHDKPIAVITIAGPVSRISAKMRTELLRDLRAAVAEISRRMGKKKTV
jgi:IclR family KDG regulon transcriptional repressor